MLYDREFYENLISEVRKLSIETIKRQVKCLHEDDLREEDIGKCLMKCYSMVLSELDDFTLSDLTAGDYPRVGW